jgi:hypothetical protein
MPSDIAFVICVVKNARHVWDQTIRKIGLGEQVEEDGGNEVKLQPLFTKGVGKKKNPEGVYGVMKERNTTDAQKKFGERSTKMRQ